MNGTGQGKEVTALPYAHLDGCSGIHDLCPFVEALLLCLAAHGHTDQHPTSSHAGVASVCTTRSYRVHQYGIVPRLGSAVFRSFLASEACCICPCPGIRAACRNAFFLVTPTLRYAVFFVAPLSLSGRHSWAPWMPSLACTPLVLSFQVALGGWSAALYTPAITTYYASARHFAPMSTLSERKHSSRPIRLKLHTHCKPASLPRSDHSKDAVRLAQTHRLRTGQKRSAKIGRVRREKVPYVAV
jgi:hypothetical protein